MTKQDSGLTKVLGPDGKTIITQPKASSYAKNGGSLKGNIVIPPAWYDREKKCWLEWIPWDEV